MSFLKHREATRVSERVDGKLRVQVCWGEDAVRAKQADREACDINWIMARYPREAERERLKTRKAFYGDFASMPDYVESANIVAKANEQFAGLSARTRERFGNSPEKFLEFCSDGANAEEMAKMGLMDPKAVERVNKARSDEKAARKKELAEAKAEGADKRSASVKPKGDPTSSDA